MYKHQGQGSGLEGVGVPEQQRKKHERKVWWVKVSHLWSTTVVLERSRAQVRSIFGLARLVTDSFAGSEVSH